MAEVPIGRLEASIAKLPDPWRRPHMAVDPHAIRATAENRDCAWEALKIILDIRSTMPDLKFTRSWKTSLSAVVHKVVDRMDDLTFPHLLELAETYKEPGDSDFPWSRPDEEVASIMLYSCIRNGGNCVTYLTNLPPHLTEGPKWVQGLLSHAHEYARSAEQRTTAWLASLVYPVIGVRGVAVYLLLSGQTITHEPEHYDDEKWLRDNPDMDPPGPRGALIVDLRVLSNDFGVLVGLPQDTEEGAPGVYDLGNGNWVALGDVTRFSTLFVAANTGNIELHRVVHSASALADLARSDEGLVELGRLAEWVWLDRGYREAHLVAMSADGWKELLEGSPSPAEQLGRRHLHLEMERKIVPPEELLRLDRAVRADPARLEQTETLEDLRAAVAAADVPEDAANPWDPFADQDPEERWPAAVDALEALLGKLHGPQDPSTVLELWRLTEWMQEHDWVPRRRFDDTRHGHEVFARFMALIEPSFDCGPVVVDQLMWLAKIFAYRNDFNDRARMERAITLADEAGLTVTADAIRWRVSGHDIDDRLAELARLEALDR